MSKPTILQYVEAAYLHGLCVENLDTGELEPPKDISDVKWIDEAIKHTFLNLIGVNSSLDSNEILQFKRDLKKRIQTL